MTRGFGQVALCWGLFRRAALGNMLPIMRLLLALLWVVRLLLLTLTQLMAVASS